MPTFETFPASKGLICFGDSITFMASTRADRGYPSVLDEMLFDRGVSVGNNGISGGGFQNSRDAYDLFHRGRGIWGACLLVGVNDIAAGLTAEAIFAGINSFVQEMLSDGLRVVLSTILPWKNGGGWTAPRQTTTEAVNSQLRALAGSHVHLRVLDGYAEFGQIDDGQLLQRGLQEPIADNLHLGSYGAQAFARLVLESIDELLAADVVVPNGLKNPAYDVAQYLNAKTVGGQLLTLATNLFIGRMPDTDRAPSTPCVSVLNTGGAAPTPFLDPARRAYFRPSVQVMVRSAADEFATGEGIARGVVEWCHQRVVADYVSWFSRDSQPAYLGPDSDQHHVWVVNLDAEYDAELG